MSAAREAVEARARQACEAGEVDAAATLVIKEYGPDVLGFLAARLRDVGAGDEVFSMFCEDLWRGLPTFQWRCSVWSWSYILARNAANRYAVSPHRRRDRHVTLAEDGPVAEMAERVRSATLPHLRTENKDRIRALRDELSAEEQTLLELRVDKNLSWLELADVMSGATAGLDSGQAKREAARLRKRFQLIKRKLRGLAEQAGLLEVAAPEPRGGGSS